MKILFLALGDETVASSRTRVFQYLPHLKQVGIHSKILVYTRQALKGKKLFGLNLESISHYYIALQLVIHSLFYRVIFIQKVLLPPIILNMLKLFRKKIVFDFDDAIYTIHQSVEDSVKDKQLPEILQKVKRRFQYIVSKSDLIILESDFTKEYVQNYNTNILQMAGPIDTERYKPSKRKSKNDIVIGWIGSPQNTFYLEPLFSVFKKLYTRFPNICFKFIGAAPIELQGANIRQVEWRLETEVNELQEFDIGIMPLPDDEWSRGKGGYKLLQYMAIGIPSVASPVGINAEMIKEGVNGFLARNEEEWYENLSILISDTEKIKKMGFNGRKTVEEKYSFFVTTPKLAKALLELK